MSCMRVGIFPYQPTWDPHQQLFSAGLEAAGCDVLRIPPRKWFPLQHAASQDIDILHLDWPHDFYNGRTALRRMLKKAMYLHGLRRARRIPVVWTAHNLATHDAPDPAYETQMVQRLIDACSGIICMSRAAETILRATYRLSDGVRTCVVPLPGHYIDWYPNTVSREEARKHLSIADARRVVLSLGRLLPYKGLEELVTAFTAVAAAGDALILAGWAPQPDFIGYLSKLAEPGRAAGQTIEIIAEAIPQDEVQLYYNACDVAAYPFRRILTSGSVMMAMSFGRCFVAPRMGSIPEVAHPRSYFGYDPDDEDGLRAALTRALRVPDLGARGLEGRAHVAQTFDWAAGARLAAGFYRDLLAKAPTRAASAAA